MLILGKDGTVFTDMESNRDLSERDLREANFRGVSIEGGNFSDADIRGNDFTGSELYDSYFYRADCSGCDFSGAVLRGVVLDEAILSRANFENAKLIQNNMGTACSLLNVDLRSVNMKGSVLTGCEYNSKTMFPLGFDPEARGMKLAS